jgi:hypothetical protein
MTDATLTPEEQADLRRLAALIVPASKKFSVPGADDPIVFADIVASMRHELNDIRAALQLASGLRGQPLASLELADQMQISAELRAMGGRAVDTLTRHILLCYYRDDRVMRSLGIEPRPPFPGGFAVEQGDWSLLDPVKARAPFWRQAS